MVIDSPNVHKANIALNFSKTITESSVYIIDSCNQIVAFKLESNYDSEEINKTLKIKADCSSGKCLLTQGKMNLISSQIWKYNSLDVSLVMLLFMRLTVYILKIGKKGVSQGDICTQFQKHIRVDHNEPHVLNMIGSDRIGTLEWNRSVTLTIVI